MEIFLRPDKAGAIMPSGNELSHLITDLAHLEDVHAVVEFGPGTGVFTREIINKAPKDVVLISIENDATFMPRLQKEFPSVHFYHDVASSLGTHLKEHNITQCDRIISGLPWSVFSEKLQQETLSAAHASLKEGGLFLTFSYIHSQYFPGGVRFRHMLENTFSHVIRSPIAWKNVPPAFVYIAQK